VHFEYKNQTAEPAKPARPSCGIASDAAALGYASAHFEYKNQTAEPAKPARPSCGIASDAAALGYAPLRASIGRGYCETV
jgi:hypothetical protein